MTEHLAMELHHPVDIKGRFVRLIPMRLEHLEGLLRIADDPDLWTYMACGPLLTQEAMAGEMKKLLHRESVGTDLPFSVLAGPGAAWAGMTRYLEIDRAPRRVEIGGTWYGARFRRTPVNTECKLLLLRHAFEVEGAHRVQLKTDLRNFRSQQAIERLGATREGVLRDHMVMPDGFVRSSVLYSIVASDWPEVRARLDAMLMRPWAWPPSASTKGEGTWPAASLGTLRSPPEAQDLPPQ